MLSENFKYIVVEGIGKDVGEKEILIIDIDSGNYPTQVIPKLTREEYHECFNKALAEHLGDKHPPKNDVLNLRKHVGDFVNPKVP